MGHGRIRSRETLDCTAFDCRIQAGNGGKLSCSQAELTQTIKAAVDMFSSISCQYPEIEGGKDVSQV